MQYTKWIKYEYEAPDDPISDACNEGNAEELGHLFKSGYDPYDVFGSGESGLIVAAENDDWQVALKFARHGFISSGIEHPFCTALEIAVQCGNFEFAKILVRNGYPMGHVLASAVKTGRLDLVEFFVEYNASVKCSSPNGRSPLAIAAKHGYLDIVKFLVEHGTNVNETTAWGTSALIRAVENHRFDVIRYLIANGAEVNFQDTQSRSALGKALLLPHYAIAEYLVENGATYTKPNGMSYSPLESAIVLKFKGAALSLIRKGERVTTLCISEEVLHNGWSFMAPFMLHRVRIPDYNSMKVIPTRIRLVQFFLDELYCTCH
jgi:ankyrin repeat protein